MKNKIYIEKAILRDITSMHVLMSSSAYKDLSEHEILLDIEFANNLNVGDAFWFCSIEEENDFKYPYVINFTDELLELWDGWYEIVSKTFYGQKLVFEVVEVHCKETQKFLGNYRTNSIKR